MSTLSLPPLSDSHLPEGVPLTGSPAAILAVVEESSPRRIGHFGLALEQMPDPAPTADILTVIRRILRPLVWGEKGAQQIGAALDAYFGLEPSPDNTPPPPAPDTYQIACARPNCGKVFAPKHPRARYCSDSCRQSAYQSRKRAKEAATHQVPAP